MLVRGRSSSMKCICQICTCGRHHCPHLPTHIFDALDKPCLISEYTDKYPCRQPQKTRSYKPCQAYERPSVKIDATTTFREAYVPHELLPSVLKERGKYKAKKGGMDFITTYKQEYNPYCIQKTASFRPIAPRHGGTAKMDTVATYTDDYRQWNEARRESMKPHDTYHPPDVAFCNTTTFADAYEFKGLPYRKSCKPVNAARVSSSPFEDLTNYREAYVPYLAEKIKPHLKHEYKPCSDAFDGLTIHQRDFKGQPGEAAKSTKPDHSRMHLDIPFCNSTESKDAYQEWPQPERFKKRSVAYIPPVVKMDLLSTTHVDYSEHRLQLRKPFRPVGHSGRSNAPFDGCSTMKEDYKQWLCKRMPAIRPQPLKEQSMDPFESMTTFRLHYVPHPPAHTHSCKQQTPTVPPSEPLEVETIYGTSYTPKEIVKCPARFKDPQGYVYEGTDTYGHKQYSSLYEAGLRSSSKEDNESTNADPEYLLPSKKVVGFSDQPRKLEVVS